MTSFATPAPKTTLPPVEPTVRDLPLLQASCIGGVFNHPPICGYPICGDGSVCGGLPDSFLTDPGCLVGQGAVLNTFKVGDGIVVGGRSFLQPAEVY